MSENLRDKVESTEQDQIILGGTIPANKEQPRNIGDVALADIEDPRTMVMAIEDQAPRSWDLHKSGW